MSKKLLSEAQVRRFQALATISPINEMAYSEEREESVEESYDEAAMKDDSMMEAEEEPMEMDAGEDEEMDQADVEMDEELVEKFMDAVSTIQQVADMLGGEAGDIDMDAETPMNMDAGEEAPMELDAGEDEEKDEEEMLEEALRGVSYIPSQKEVVKQVAKRVAKRLQEAKNAQAKLDKALGRK